MKKEKETNKEKQSKIIFLSLIILLTIYNKAIEFNPQLVQAFYNRGLAKYKLVDKQGTIQDCNRAIEINPQFV